MGESNIKHTNNGSVFTLVVPEGVRNMRLDAFLTVYVPDYSRTFYQKIIAQAYVAVNGKASKASALVKDSDVISVHIPIMPSLHSAELSVQKQEALKKLGVSIMHTHPDFFVVNKPADLVVHKPANNSSTLTLVDWLVMHTKEIINVGHPERPGIVHRIDKDTSGLLIIPRSNYAHNIFGSLFKNRAIKKSYVALVKGHPEVQGTIDLPIGRDPIIRNQMTINGIRAREAITHYKVLKYFSDSALVEVFPVTGRTHQIRVHFKAIGHPLIGDNIYGTKTKSIKRHALHASALTFTFDNNVFHFECPLPQDMQDLVKSLNCDSL